MELILKYFPDLSSHQIEQFRQLAPLYKNWNEKINVISRKDIDHIFEHHILHSLAIAKVVSFPAGAKILDLGTGGGFPGIPLAVMFPEAQFLLVDSIAKKLTVVGDIARAINLKNVVTQHARVETLKGQYDYITNRAVAKLDKLCEWISDIDCNNLISLKGGKIDEEIKLINGMSTKFHIVDYFQRPYFNDKYVIHVRK